MAMLIVLWDVGKKKRESTPLMEQMKGLMMIRVQASALRHNSSLRLAENGAPHPLAMRAAATSCSLLITGETGTGKGHLARWIHDHSPRSKKPFVPVNCGAIPDGLIDSHL